MLNGSTLITIRNKNKLYQDVNKKPLSLIQKLESDFNEESNQKEYF
jgi:hypothetical protein